MEGGKRMYAEMTVVVVLGMMWLSMPIIPTSAQSQVDLTCWEKFSTCLKEHLNQTSKPEFNVDSPLFNATEFLCCSLLQQAALSTKPCLCAMDPFIHQNPTNGTALLKTFTICNVISTDSLTLLDFFCAGSIPSNAEGVSKLENLGTMSSLKIAGVEKTSSNSESQTGSPKTKTSAANKIALCGSFSSMFILFIAYYLSY